MGTFQRSMTAVNETQLRGPLAGWDGRGRQVRPELQTRSRRALAYNTRIEQMAVTHAQLPPAKQGTPRAPHHGRKKLWYITSASFVDLPPTSSPFFSLPSFLHIRPLRNKTTKSNYPPPDIQDPSDQLRREFSRCPWPSLSCERPLRDPPGLQASPAVQQPQRDISTLPIHSTEVIPRLSISRASPTGFIETPEHPITPEAGSDSVRQERESVCMRERERKGLSPSLNNSNQLPVLANHTTQRRQQQQQLLLLLLLCA